jgi:hypothetical protein
MSIPTMQFITFNAIKSNTIEVKKLNSVYIVVIKCQFSMMKSYQIFCTKLRDSTCGFLTSSTISAIATRIIDSLLFNDDYLIVNVSIPLHHYYNTSKTIHNNALYTHEN